ncbi:hypothetical protein F511_09808 [Dorcoceras hygrometricum]|uniref:Uncharacterized protein n=1 Tax=Dorcoceras hygrometricum TaxID=472368 RepID=A0A2Z7BWF7_9LAMI|nr:hypothetical protein F511_09808 [Dorcoceras hygrometricum]
MASSLIKNAIQVYFDSILGMEHEGMVAMFKALLLSELSGFLGCSSAIYETTLVEFFHNALVWDGLSDLHEVPKDLVFEARSAFSYDGKQLSTSCKKREMTFEFWLLNDILAKSVTVKAGSFDAVTHERFLMMSAIHGGVKIECVRSVKDIVAKEEQVLTWAEIDSFNIAIQRRVYIIEKWECCLKGLTLMILPPALRFVEPFQDLDSISPLSRLIRDQWTEVFVAAVQFSLIGFLHRVVHLIKEISKMVQRGDVQASLVEDMFSGTVRGRPSWYIRRVSGCREHQAGSPAWYKSKSRATVEVQDQARFDHKQSTKNSVERPDQRPAGMSTEIYELF